jgi:hypothetical protein
MRRICGAVVVALLALATAATAALAHGGGGTDYISEIRAVAPSGAGLDVEVLDRDDRIALRNDSGKTVVVEGYNGEPYARLKPNGTVEVNVRSPALYLNEDRFAKVDVPERADERAAPVWKVVDRSGRFEWHDHRIHWMGATRPAIVREPQQRTKVLDWTLPLRVGAGSGWVNGTLTWVGRPDDSFPIAAAIGLGVVLVAGVALVVVVRRRRRRSGGGEGGSGSSGAGGASGDQVEAW